MGFGSRESYAGLSGRPSLGARRAEPVLGSGKARFNLGTSCAGMQGRPSLGMWRACPIPVGSIPRAPLRRNPLPRGSLSRLCLSLTPFSSSQLTINTAIVYMHRFYMVQSFTQFHRNSVVPAALFLAAKVEEQPRKLEHVIKVAHACLHPQEPLLDTKSEAYLQQAQDLVILESIILQTLGFEITIDHPHTHVVKCTQLVRASKDLAQTSYFMATNSLHLTTFSLQYTPPVVACVCIHLACKWSNWEIPVSTDGKHWWEYVDGTVTLELLDELTHEFLQILEKTPSRLKRIRNWRASQAARKSKTDDHGDDENLSEQTILNMISRNNSSDMNIAGLMSMSTSSTAGAGPALLPAPS
ncbi:cyclin-T1 [Manacus vitellinus]|uniref:cyclin-T1 n=1 Tax=Manacus vitellinus TaxID=328815 RepID=UPI00115D8A58|nr:cyclin-T1 [Manacus vitellinus]